MNQQLANNRKLLKEIRGKLNRAIHIKDEKEIDVLWEHAEHVVMHMSTDGSLEWADDAATPIEGINRRATYKAIEDLYWYGILQQCWDYHYKKCFEE